MARRKESERRSRSRRKRSREKRKRRGSSRSSSRSASVDNEPKEPYTLEIIPGRNKDAYPMFDISCKVKDTERLVPHVVARPGEEYLVRVTNHSRRHIACAVAVDGENALLKDGSLIVAGKDCRELPGFLVSKNFIGKEYVKEYKNFLFSKPKVVEKGDSTDPGEAAYSTYGSVTCEVFEAVCDEEAASDDEMNGQTTHYRGAGLHGSFDERVIPEGKKSHLLYSAVTAQGSRQAISNSVRGRWWVRGSRHYKSLEVRYREAHSLMLLGVRCEDLGIIPVKAEDRKDGILKDESDDEKKEESKKECGGFERPFSSSVMMCDLTDGDEQHWTERELDAQAPAVTVDNL